MACEVGDNEFGTRRVIAATTSEALPTPTGAALLCRPYQRKPEGGCSEGHKTGG
jgi:hypothetical protein